MLLQRSKSRRAKSVWAFVLCTAAVCICFALFITQMLRPPAAQAATGCSASGCYDTFDGPAGTLVNAYNSNWSKVSGTGDIYTTGSSNVEIAGSNYAYYTYSGSTSETSQIMVRASNTTGNYTRVACVRLTQIYTGYCVGFGAVSNGSYNNCFIAKSGQYMGNASCGSVSATLDHTLAVVASGSSTTTLTVYVDDVVQGTITDTSTPFASSGSGFGLIGDGTAANSDMGAWQDFRGTAAVFGCPGGSGTCFDKFSGAAGTALSTYNNSWTLQSGSDQAHLTGAQSIQLPSGTYAEYRYTPSTSETSQILVPPSQTSTNYARLACVRISGGDQGYCVGFTASSNGIYSNCLFYRGGQYQGNAGCDPVDATVAHTLSITASGTNSTTLTAALDGVAQGTITDSSTPPLNQGSGIGLIRDANDSDSTLGAWQDFSSPAVAASPHFSLAPGSYNGAQTTTIQTRTPNASIYYTTDNSTPTITSSLYTGPITISSSETIKAIAVASSLNASAVSSASYNIVPPVVATPTFTPVSPYAGVGTTVSIYDETPNATILYCQDTSNTCTPSQFYTSGIPFTTTSYIRAMATVSGYTQSAVASWRGTYTTATITTSACPGGMQYQPYGGCTLTATGGTPPYNYGWSKTSGNGLVEGLSLNPSTGIISGTAYGQGTYYIDFTVTDASGGAVAHTIPIAVKGNNSLGSCSFFPADTIWHLNVSGLPIDTSPAAPIAPVYASSHLHLVFGANLGDGGIPFLVVPAGQAFVPVTTTAYQSYFTSAPFPSYAPVEGTSNGLQYGADNHALVVQQGSNAVSCKLWEMYNGAPQASGAWVDASNAFWDLGSYDMLPQDTGSTDAAGLPVVPLLWNYDEVAGSCAPGAECGVVTHPGRLTLNHTLNYHVWPATAQSGLGGCSGGYQDVNRLLSQTNPPTSCSGSSPMGEIYRLKSTVANPAACNGHPQAQVLLTALRNYGLMVTDNGITGGIVATADARWDNDDLSCLTAIQLSDFEPVNVSSKMKDLNSSQIQ